MNNLVEIMGAGDRPLRIKDVATWLGFSQKTVRRLIDDGSLKSKKIRGLRLVMASELKVMIEGASS